MPRIILSEKLAAMDSAAAHPDAKGSRAAALAKSAPPVANPRGDVGSTRGPSSPSAASLPSAAGSPAAARSLGAASSPSAAGSPAAASSPSAAGSPAAARSPGAAGSIGAGNSARSERSESPESARSAHFSPKPQYGRAPVYNGPPKGAASSASAVMARSASSAPSTASSSVPAQRDGAARFTGPQRRSGAGTPARGPAGPKSEPVIVFQDYFKSIGPRTYAAQMKNLSNGNQLLVVTEGKRDEETREVRKTRLYVYGEDFDAFFALVQKCADFARKHPVAPDLMAKRRKMWQRISAKAEAAERAVPPGATSTGAGAAPADAPEGTRRELQTVG